MSIEQFQLHVLIYIHVYVKCTGVDTGFFKGGGGGRRKMLAPPGIG